jgi:hypothetical protein
MYRPDQISIDVLNSNLDALSIHTQNKKSDIILNIVDSMLQISFANDQFQIKNEIILMLNNYVTIKMKVQPVNDSIATVTSLFSNIEISNQNKSYENINHEQQQNHLAHEIAIFFMRICSELDYNGLMELYTNEKLMKYMNQYYFERIMDDSCYLYIRPYLDRNTIEQYFKLIVPFKINSNNEILIFKKTEASLTTGYMWHDIDNTPDHNIFADDAFVNDPNNPYVKHINLFGLHTYGGFRLFFRPDLTEVIHLLNMVIDLTELQTIKRIYVTTKPYPHDTLCYDSIADRHRAMTIAHIVYKQS